MKRRRTHRKGHPVIKGIAVDTEALLSIAHTCTPGLCTIPGNCCRSFRVCIDGDELGRIIGVMPEASAYAEGLISGDSFRNVFDDMENGLFAVDEDESGLCIFAYQGDSNEILCSLHSAALRMDCRPEEIKPAGCVLWPLALSEDSPLFLSVDKDAFSFPCNEQRDRNVLSLDPAVEDIIVRIFGDGFRRKIEEHIASAHNP